jgi:hypothetical protein
MLAFSFDEVRAHFFIWITLFYYPNVCHGFKLDEFVETRSAV